MKTLLVFGLLSMMSVLSSLASAQVNADGSGDLRNQGSASAPTLTITKTPAKPVLGDKITYTVEAQAKGEASMGFIQIFINKKKMVTCYKSQCSFTTKVITSEPGFGVLAVDAGGIATTQGILPAIDTSKYVQLAKLDTDGDGIFDLVDNCVAVFNPPQTDQDGDGVGDEADACCPGCRSPGFPPEYCGPDYGGFCWDEVSSGGHWYWEEIYGSVDNNGCGCYGPDGEDIFTRTAVVVETEEPQHCNWETMFCTPARAYYKLVSDECVDEFTVREYICGPNGLDHVDMACPAGTPSCVNGRCVCGDSDGGKNYYVRGTVNDHTDECFTDTDGVRKLREYFCDSGLSPASEVVVCEFGCVDGACKCEDSDGGKNYDVAGRAGTEVDTCLDLQTLSEVYTHVAPDASGGRCEILREEHTCAGSCRNNACQPPTCEDRVKNQGEEDIDCGGPCPLPCDLCSLSDSKMPTRFWWGDWKGRSWLTPVKDQAQCGSCWAFAAVGAVEAKALIELTKGWLPDDFSNPCDCTGAWNLPVLSEQMLVSGCTDAWGDCTGGSHTDAFSAIRDNGIVDQNCFEYGSGACLNSDGDCVTTCGSASDCSNPRSCSGSCTDNGDAWNLRRWSIHDHGVHSGRDKVADMKKELVCNGPLANCSSDWGHCFVIVGWDSDSNICKQKYGKSGCWILKNSWGVGSVGVVEEHRNSDRYDDSWWSLNGFVFIPFDGHDYSRSVRLNARHPWGVSAPAGWTGVPTP